MEELLELLKKLMAMLEQQMGPEGMQKALGCAASRPSGKT